MNQVIRSVKEHRYGIIIGGLTGAVAAYYAIQHGIGLNDVMASGKGMIDSMMNRSAAVDIANTKIYTVFIAFGAGIGYAADILITYIKRK